MGEDGSCKPSRSAVPTWMSNPGLGLRVSGLGLRGAFSWAVRRPGCGYSNRVHHWPHFDVPHFWNVGTLIQHKCPEIRFKISACAVYVPAFACWA